MDAFCLLSTAVAHGGGYELWMETVQHSNSKVHLKKVVVCLTHRPKIIKLFILLLMQIVFQTKHSVSRSFDLLHLFVWVHTAVIQCYQYKVCIFYLNKGSPGRKTQEDLAKSPPSVYTGNYKSVYSICNGVGVICWNKGMSTSDELMTLDFFF